MLSGMLLVGGMLTKPPVCTLLNVPVASNTESSLTAELPQHRGFSGEGRIGRHLENGDFKPLETWNGRLSDTEGCEVPLLVMDSSVPSTSHLSV